MIEEQKEIFAENLNRLVLIVEIYRKEKQQKE